jgi:hypothetical protein
MNLATLKDVLMAFADDRADLIVDKSRLLVQIQGELISATTTIREGTLYVTEDGQTQPATRWVADRVAQLPLVADRIASILPENPRFVRPRGLLLDQLEEAPEEAPQPVADALAAVTEFLGRRPAGMCSVLYLTSDAGEGKTTLINTLARRQAVAYKERATDWLLLPFSLGGNPFLRLDNVIAAGLLNQLRIRRFYLDAFLQLVRLGYIVPALDGFEEVFVETSGEAVSSLGNLISDLRGEGTLLIAARTAYFEIKRLDRHARLFDAIPSFEVGFGKISLLRWGRGEFVAYCKNAGVNNPDSLYDDLARRLQPDHPLLTRPFFVCRIAELAQTAAGAQFLQAVEPQVQETFRPFVDRILEREVREKWIDKYNQPAEPLLDVSEHHELLRLLAEEMWTSKRGSLPKDTADFLVDIYCESRKKSPSITRQVKERLPNHALLVAGAAGTQISFDHEHFREFFLGEQLGEYIRVRSASDIRKLLRVDSLPPWTLDSAVAFALRSHESPASLIAAISEVAATEGPTSFVRENGGGLCLRLAEKWEGPGAPAVISSMVLPQNALAGRILNNVQFESCYFRTTAVPERSREVAFKKCEFEHIEAESSFSFEGITFEDCAVHGLTITSGEQAVDFYDPADIETYLARSRATLIKANQRSLVRNELPVDDSEIKIVRKLLVVFRRANQVSEHVIRLRLGMHASRFFDHMKSELLQAGVLIPVKHRGGAVKDRFRLGRSMATIAAALAESRGSYPAFLAKMRSSPANQFAKTDAGSQ